MIKHTVILFGLLLVSATAFGQDAPLWLTRRGAAYPPELYLTGVGEGRTAEEAQTKALAQIAQFFQTRVGDTQTLLYAYNDALTTAENTQASQNTVVSSEADFFGVEFADLYRDKSGVCHALAAIDREEALQKYDARIQANALALRELMQRYENSPNPRGALKKLGEARELAAATASYADMAILLNGAVSSRYTVLSAIAAGIDGAIEANKKRLTVTISLNDESARAITLRTAEILRSNGFLLADSGGAYTVIINFQANENTTRNYYTIEPVLEIIMEVQDGTPLVTYQKKYPLFRHITREEALQRALRNIEQDLTGEFARAVRMTEE
jgi:hypothetical protein